MQDNKKQENTVFFLNGSIDPEKIFGKKIEGNYAIPDKYKTSEDLPFTGKPECEIIRHYTKLSTKNFSVDSGFYPLGSCTMKYNPKINERISSNPDLNIHPSELQKNQFMLKILFEFQEYLKSLTGMSAFTLQPAAGANGEYAGLRIIKEFFSFRKEVRKKVIVPDNSHGTNPATAAALGYEMIQINSGNDGLVDIETLSNAMSTEVAALMLTNPNTLGLFEKNIVSISEIVHSHGGLLYYDGANFNAIAGKAKPAEMGFDVMHLNLHKTFSTPHGGGGPGAGPVGVVDKLVEFLPIPIIEYNEKNNSYFLNYDYPCSIGKIHPYFGNVNVLIKAYVYISMLGVDGLKKMSEAAVLNANYLKEKLKKHYHLPFDTICKHEFVLDNKYQKDYKIKTLDIAKRLIDYGYHPPTIYFPLIVHESIMIEPTETETKETLDAFADALIKIADEAKDNPELLRNAPMNSPVKRLDETLAARNPVIQEIF